MPSPSLKSLYPSWQKLDEHSKALKQTSLSELFHQDKQRSNTYSLEAAGLYLDFSKNLINSESTKLFEQLCSEANIDTAIQGLFSGKEINNTEKRAAWHTALRNHNKPEAVQDTLDKMQRIADAVHDGSWKGYKGETINTVVNIGIGGSDLGPKMVCSALAPYSSAGIQTHFVSNVDPMELESILPSLVPGRTLFIVASKSFSTLETLCNANKAKQWFTEQSDTKDISQHFVAISSAKQKALDFGIEQENILPIWDWVGGRYSLCSAVGLVIALSIGWKNFELLLKGAQSMDEHFASKPATENLPIVLALIGLYYQHFFNASSHAILPYDQSLQYFPDFLQQLDMESNGKNVNLKGEPLSYTSGPVIWGEVGTNGQHSFHQLLHQGTHFIPCDFILPLSSHSSDSTQHRHLVANCLGQSQAMLYGKTLQQTTEELKQSAYSAEEATQLAPHKVIKGNRPHNIICMDKLSPETLGALIALYEHKVFVQGTILQINSFDQWGVELGKQLSSPLFDALVGENTSSQEADSSVTNLISRYKDANDFTK